MNRAGWDRWAPLGGIVFVGLFVAAFVLIHNAPTLDDSAAKTAAFYLDHRGRVLTATSLLGLGLFFFLWFLGSFANTLREAGEGRLAAVTVAAGATFVSLFAGFGVIAGALAFKVAKDADPGIVLALSDLTWALGVLVSFPAAALVAAISIGSWRARVLPGLLCWAGFLGTVALLAAGTTWARNGFWAPDGAYPYIALTVFMAWVLAAGIAGALWRSGEAPTTPGPARRS